MAKSEPDVSDLLARTSLGEIEVSFAGKGMKLDKAEDADDIVKAISDEEGMQCLRLSGNTVGVEAAKAIAKALETRPKFQRAKWSDMFTGRLRSEIPPSLETLGAAIITAKANLVELDLSDNAFGPDGVKACTELLKSESGYSLQELRFNNNGLGVGGGKILSEALLECHKNSSAVGKPLSLKVFITGRNRLENEGATALASAFKVIGTLEQVEMPQNGINHPGVSALADAFAANTKLRVLNLNDNTFTERGAEAMARAFNTLSDLEVVNFGDCLVRSGGAEAIATALENGVPKLRELNLSYGEINKNAAVKLADSIRDKKQLEKLELNGNCFGDEGIDLLKEKLESSGRIESLGSLSDDEGEGEDDDDDEYEDVDDEDEDVSDGEEVKEPAEVQPVQGPLLYSQVAAVRPKKSEEGTVTPEAFFKTPTAANLLNLGKNRAKLLTDHLGRVASANSVVEAFFKVASVMDTEKDDVERAVYECSDSIMSKGLTSDDSVRPEEIVNGLLVRLGLLKSEDKIQPVRDLHGPLITLAHVVKQDYFPKSSVNIMTVFISRPHRIIEKNQNECHKLLEALYSV